MCIITFLSYRLAHILHRDRGLLVYACIVWESHESWTYRCIFLSLFFSYHNFIAFHHISLVVFVIFSSLFYLLLVLLHVFSTLSGDPPQFITWRIVTSFPLSIPRTLIQKSLVWEGYLVKESFWECTYPLLISYLGFICLCSGYAHLYICKKNE